MEPVSFFVNGEERTVLAEADWTLLYILREKLTFKFFMIEGDAT